MATKRKKFIPGKQDSIYLQAIGHRIQELRGEMTQKELAEKIGNHHHTTIGRIERGENNVSLITLRKIADALGVTVSELLDFE